MGNYTLEEWKCQKLESRIERLQLELSHARAEVKQLRAGIKQWGARANTLQRVVDNLCEQQDRQIDMEACAGWQSYPSKFPEWEQAWEQAREVRWGE